MSRVVELINRTNQFNTTGSKTTISEMKEMSDKRDTIIAQVRDKFGDMGIVGALVLEGGSPAEISHFVLSCRVFGFGIEDAMLNALRRVYGDSGTGLTAKLVENPVNGPCRDVYERHGFTKQNDVWLMNNSGAVCDPVWLDITNDLI